MTELDQLYPGIGDDLGRLRFYQALADATLFVLLAEEARGERITPRIFDLDDGPVLMAFDREDRLAAWGQGSMPYAALPGRLIARQLSGSGVSLGLNLGCGAASETLLPPEALRWLAETLDHRPEEVEARPTSYSAPRGMPDILADALRFTLTAAAGLARSAHLVGVRYADGRRGHLLAVLGADPAAEPALAGALAEAVTFSGVDAAELDIVFLPADAAGLADLLAVAVHFDIPVPARPGAAPTPAAPGSDPDRPPRLR